MNNDVYAVHFTFLLEVWLRSDGSLSTFVENVIVRLKETLKTVKMQRESSLIDLKFGQ